MRTCLCLAVFLQCLTLGLATDAAYCATISAGVTLSEYSGDPAAVPISVELLQGGAVVQSESLFLDAGNRFMISGVTPDVYDVRVKASHWLSGLRANVNVIGDIDLGTVILVNGDCDGDDEVTSTDLSILGLALGSVPDDSNWDPTADMDGDGEITSTDLSILGLTLGQTGESVETTEYVYIPGAPSGNASPAVNVSEIYSTTGSTSSQAHPIEYSFNWGDGSSSPWSTSTSASHSWNSSGTNTVTVDARCQEHPSISSLSAEVTVNVTGFDPREMIYIPAGSFLMGNSGVGNDATYASYVPEEFPRHSVYLSEYYIGKYEVTRGHYRDFINAGGYTNPAYWSTVGWNWIVSNNRTLPNYWDDIQTWIDAQTFTQTDNHPVVGVSYYEAEAFCNWAGGHLPTEAQWEKAARWTGTQSNVYPWGDAWSDEYCNNWWDHSSLGGGYQRYQSAPVGSYPGYGSPSGCQDMAGNVWEWCKDWYSSQYYSQSPTNDPQGPDSGLYRGLRGGGWRSGDDYTRGGNRDNYYANSYNPSIGFRLAR